MGICPVPMETGITTDGIIETGCCCCGVVTEVIEESGTLRVDSAGSTVTGRCVLAIVTNCGTVAMAMW